MNLIKNLFSYVLSVYIIGVSISPTTSALTKSVQHCASLYSGQDSPEQILNVPTNSKYKSLHNVPLSSDLVWNITSSVSVESGCTLTACNESNYSGQCNNFPEGLSSLPHHFGNILSLSCSCPRICRCQDVYNIRNSTCARAYFSEGGCNSCDPYYINLEYGEHDQLPKDFGLINVTSLMVRPGCNLTVYDEAAMGGNQNTVQGIVENWTQPVRSYVCWCPVIPVPPVPSESPETPAEEYPPPLNIPNSSDQIIPMINGHYGRHPGLLAALQSNRANRSPKNAYILLLGSSGADKTATIKTLFDNPNLPFINPQDTSTTKPIQELRIPVPLNHLGIQNSQLRLINTPELSATGEISNNARALATLEAFLDSHEELNLRIPNVVLIFHNFTDQLTWADSQFIKTLRGLDSLSHRITDKNFSNVVFVFSHSSSESNPTNKLKGFKKLIQEYSNFPRPVLMTLAENKAPHLLRINGYFKLPTGDFYPQNLFHKIIQVTRGGRDAIGQAVVTSAFKNPDAFNVSSLYFSLGEDKRSRVVKYLTKSVGYKTEVSEHLEEASKTMSRELKTRFPHALQHLQKPLSNFQTIPDIRKDTTDIVKLFTNLPQNDAVRYLLLKALNISSPVFNQSYLSGYSYNVFSDSPLPVSPFNLGDLQNSEIGYKLPSIITCNVNPQHKDILRFFKTRREYLEYRLGSLSIGGNIPLETFKGTVKHGYNILDEISAGNLTAPIITAVREIRIFELTLDNIPYLTNDFKKAVKRLKPFNANDHKSVEQWNAFFHKYGTHAVQSVYGGGAIEFQVNANKTSEASRILNAFFQFVEDISLGIKSQDVSPNYQDIQHLLTFRFIGGDTDNHTYFLSNLSLIHAADLLEKWKESLISSPTILSTELRLIPLSQITKRLGKNEYFSKEINRAMELLFNLTWTPPSEILPDGDRQSTPVIPPSAGFMEESRRSDMLQPIRMIQV